MVYDIRTHEGRRERLMYDFVTFIMCNAKTFTTKLGGGELEEWGDSVGAGFDIVGAPCLKGLCAKGYFNISVGYDGIRDEYVIGIHEFNTGDTITFYCNDLDSLVKKLCDVFYIDIKYSYAWVVKETLIKAESNGSDIAYAFSRGGMIDLVKNDNGKWEVKPYKVSNNVYEHEFNELCEQAQVAVNEFNNI